MSQLDDYIQDPTGAVNERTGTFYEGRTYLGDYYGFTFSPNNPYLKDFENAKKGTYDEKRNYERAREWEHTQINLQQQLAIDYAIKQEQREYEDPLQQSARLRRAGVNVDISDATLSSGSGGSGTGLAGPDLLGSSGTPSDPPRRDLDIFNSVTSFIGSLGTVATQAVDFGKNISTWADQLSMSHNDAAISAHNVELASNAVKSSELGLASQELGNFQTNLGVISDLSNMFPDDYTEDDIKPILESMGAKNLDAIMPMLSAYRSNPKMQALYQQHRYNEKVNRAQNEGAVYTQLRETYSNLNEAKYFESMSARTISEFRSIFDKLTLTPENAEVASETFTNELETSNVNSELALEEANFAIESFRTRVSQLQDYLNSAIETLNKYETAYNTNPTSTNKAFLDAQRVLVDRLMGASTKTLSQMYDIADSWHSAEFLKDEFVGSDGKPNKFIGNMQGRFVDINNFLFTRLYNAENGTVDFSPAVSALSGAAIAYLTKGRSVSSNPRPNNMFTISYTQNVIQ